MERKEDLIRVYDETEGFDWKTKALGAIRLACIVNFGGLLACSEVFSNISTTQQQLI